MMPLLSILIPTIPERKNIFDELFNKILAQREALKQVGLVEILVNNEIRFIDGGPSIGEKRQKLLDGATGQWLCYLDDDEDIAGNYLETLVDLCQQDKDVCTFKSFIQLEQYWGIVNMRLRYVNEQMTPDYEVHRSPWHICPIRNEIAKKYKFESLNYGEDWRWMEQVLKDVKTEAHSERIIHSYRHGKHSESDKALEYQKQNHSI